MKISGIKLLESERIPFWYGFAWRYYNEMAIVVFPIPFNFLARWIREVYLFLKLSGAAKINANYLAGYEKGRAEGENYGMIKGKREYQEELLKGIEKMRQETDRKRNLPPLI